MSNATLLDWFKAHRCGSAAYQGIGNIRKTTAWGAWKDLLWDGHDESVSFYGEFGFWVGANPPPGVPPAVASIGFAVSSHTSAAVAQAVLQKLVRRPDNPFNLADSLHYTVTIQDGARAICLLDPAHPGLVMYDGTISEILIHPPGAQPTPQVPPGAPIPPVPPSPTPPTPIPPPAPAQGHPRLSPEQRGEEVAVMIRGILRAFGIDEAPFDAAWPGLKTLFVAGLRLYRGLVDNNPVRS